MVKPLKRIAVTGGAGQIAYSLLFRIAYGDLLGCDQPLALQILELPEALPALEGVRMELEDGAYSLLSSIVVTSDPYKAFEGAHYAFLLGAKPRGPGMERVDLLQANGRIFVEQGRALNAVADSLVKVFVVGNPCNTNCLIAMSHAPRLPRHHFFAMTRLDQNRATSLLAQKAQVPLVDVSHVAIWGNHSSTQVPDFLHARIKGQPAESAIDRSWLEKEFISQVQTRGAAIIQARGKSSAASAASALIDAVHDTIYPSQEGHWFSTAILSDGNPYGIADDIIFSFPCRAEAEGRVSIIPGLTFDPFLNSKIQATEKELKDERELVKDLINTN